MRKMTNKKGFTLMEMLIVVAIIAILVAIAIPTVTTALESSREATDAANIRSAYADLMVAAMTDDTSASIVDNGNYTVTYANSKYTATITLTQKKDGWQNSSITNIAGIKITTATSTNTSSLTGKLDKVSNGENVTIEYTPSTNTLVFSDGSSNS